MTAAPNVTALGDRFTTALRHFRFEADLAQTAVAAKLDWSVSKIIRQEAGTVTPSVTDVRALLDCYGVTGAATVEKYVDMARLIRAARQRDAVPVSTRPASDRRRLRRLAEALCVAADELTGMADG